MKQNTYAGRILKFLSKCGLPKDLIMWAMLIWVSRANHKMPSILLQNSHLQAAKPQHLLSTVLPNPKISCLLNITKPWSTPPNLPKPGNYLSLLLKHPDILLWASDELLSVHLSHAIKIILILGTTISSVLPCVMSCEIEICHVLASHLFSFAQISCSQLHTSCTRKTASNQKSYPWAA